MNFNLRNRIAFFYIVVTGILIGILFLTLYLIVFKTVYSHLDGDLDTESQEIEKSIVVLNNEFVFANPFEWTEKEHGQIELNPVFIQITNTTGKIIKKSHNLLNSQMEFTPDRQTNYYFSTSLSGSPTRQLQLPIKNPTGKILGFIIIAMPLEESAVVLNNLSYVLLVAYPLVLIGLFFSSRLIAGSSLSPINKVIKTAEKITKENLDERIELPEHKDELHILTSTINKLLDRLEDAMLREKQFTSDASHELRTPLSVIKGTLEVLIRKPREIEHYESKIKYCINEVDRMTSLVDQLLMMARIDSNKHELDISSFNINNMIGSVISRMISMSEEKNLTIHFDPSGNYEVNADHFMTEMIFDNLMSNAIKYTESGRDIHINLISQNKDTIVEIIDEGIGMSEEQIEKIFDRFYRADESRNSQINGNGLGLAIVRRLASIQNILLKVESEVSKGTKVSVIFPG